ncbi:hypothetical protein [Ideonella paludis]|uniref:PilZ domain-containing protein n=2 Tax=Ideonella paludis TaxID=1233411 RepID=A0ABS5DRM2_9BURK|nr:hypothetical protein [Ideonella paludis]MBQ0933785.1 hypothetical protein [Ideonella paludis]
MNKSDTAASSVAPHMTPAEARIDWSLGRVIGFSVPADVDAAFDVVQLLLDGQCVNTAVANLSVFELARDLSGLRLPSRENSAFELRIPQECLLPSHLSAMSLRLELRSSRGATFFEHALQGPHELMRLTQGTPADLLFEVQFKHLNAGYVHGVVKDKLGTGVRPNLQVKLNEHAADPLPIYEQSADGRVHLFSVPLRADRLKDGLNHLHIISASGQPMASYPVHIGNQVLGEADRRIASLEAEVAFLKHMVLNQNNEALPARLAFMKSEIIAICSDMLSLQRTNLERESSAAKTASLPASSLRATSR